LPETDRQPLSEAMRDLQARWPETVLLPHPSPRNTGWFQRNIWFETELLPVLRARVEEILAASYP
jgi:uracil-DNA glycosylase